MIFQNGGILFMSVIVIILVITPFDCKMVYYCDYHPSHILNKKTWFEFIEWIIATITCNKFGLIGNEAMNDIIW